MAIADEYVERQKNINIISLDDGTDLNVDLDADNQFRLKCDMFRKIYLLNEEIYKKTGVSIKNQGLDNDYDILARLMEEYRNNGNKTIGGEHPTRSRRL